MCQQEGSPVSSMGKTLQYTHQCIMVVFTIHILHFCYMVKFIHDSFKLNVTTVERQARMKWTWMMMDAMRCGCYVELCRCDVMWWCHVSKWSTNHWQQCNNAEIQKSTTTEYSFQKEIRRNKHKKRRTKPQAAFCLGPRESSFEVVCFRDWQGVCVEELEGFTS